MLGLLISILILALICSVIFWLINFLGLPDPIRKIVIVLLVVIALIYVISMLGGYAPPLLPHARY